jgi:transforming growth factor-beta-induced protein
MKSIRLLVLPMVLAVSACTEEMPTLPAALAQPGEPVEGRGAVTPSAPAPEPTIVDVALSVNSQTGEFSTLIAAVLRAGIAGELSARGQRTVFAPTDAAFAKLGLDATNIDTVPVDALTGILLYHVSPGRRNAASVVNANRIVMASGGFTTVRREGGSVFIDGARIIATDVEASNGLIHVIDAVLIP